MLSTKSRAHSSALSTSTIRMSNFSPASASRWRDREYDPDSRITPACGPASARATSCAAAHPGQSTRPSNRSSTKICPAGPSHELQPAPAKSLDKDSPPKSDRSKQHRQLSRPSVSKIGTIRAGFNFGRELKKFSGENETLRCRATGGIVSTTREVSYLQRFGSQATALLQGLPRRQYSFGRAPRVDLHPHQSTLHQWIPLNQLGSLLRRHTENLHAPQLARIAQREIPPTATFPCSIIRFSDSGCCFIASRYSGEFGFQLAPRLNITSEYCSSAGGVASA